MFGHRLAALLFFRLALAAAGAGVNAAACVDGACHSGEDEGAALLQSRAAQKKGLRSTDYDCQIDDDTISVGLWSANKRQWCCANNGTGCQEFSKAQLIGLAINTFPEKVGTNLTRDEDGKLMNANITGEVYVGDYNETADVLARFNLMKQAVEKAKSEADLDSSPSTLKIFMAPEFFFRGADGAYNTTDLYDCFQDGVHSCANSAVMLLLNEMHEFASEDRWSDWLFVFGTVVAANPSTTNESEWSFYNVAPVIRGGPNAKGFLVQKTYISSIDFIECALARSSGMACDTKKGKEGDYAEVSDDISELMKPNWQLVHTNTFEVGGVFFGVEICLDHAAYVLEAQLKKLGVLPGGGVQVQLVTSAGMHLNYGVVPDGAPVFLQDGMPNFDTSWGSLAIFGDSLKAPPALTQSASQRLTVQKAIGAFGKNWSQEIKGYFAVGEKTEVDGRDAMLLKTLSEPKLKVFAPLEIPPSGRF